MAVLAEARRRAEEEAERSAPDDDEEWYDYQVGPGDLVI